MISKSTMYSIQIALCAFVGGFLIGGEFVDLLHARSPNRTGRPAIATASDRQSPAGLYSYPAAIEAGVVFKPVEISCSVETVPGRRCWRMRPDYCDELK